MLVFGDHTEPANPAGRLIGIEEALRQASVLPAGIKRHAVIASALIEGGRLLQGIADAEFHAEQRDSESPAVQALAGWLRGIARMLCHSWYSGFLELGGVPQAPDPAPWPHTVELKNPEGFAFYALYPEAFADAARRLRLKGPQRVIGIRSIGASLGAVVAAALGAPEFVTVRPFGDPFARKIAVAPELEHRLLNGNAHFVIVDEGPGQSGSSFGAVGDWLQARGVAPDRIAFLPSHAGAPGAHASPAHRIRWETAQREVADLGDRLPALLASWLAAGGLPVDGSLREISGGAWRSLNDAEWPPVIAMFERRKFLFQSGGRPLVARFAGLGRTGEEKLSVARRLHGLIPEPIALVHGFLVEPWHHDATRLARHEQPVEEIGSYLGARAALLADVEGQGASIRDLYDMAHRNLALTGGEDLASELVRWEPKLPELERKVRRYPTDNRLDRHEWLRTAGGQLLKADALDHHQGHDLIGCQDLAWDVAGAIAEFDLDDAEAEQMIEIVERQAGRAIDRQLLGFCELIYAAFRLGLASFGVDLASDHALEQARLRSSASRYMSRAQHLLLQRSGPRLGRNGRSVTNRNEPALEQTRCKRG